MPNYEDPARMLEAVFHALADATRRAVVERLSVGSASVGELARPFAMTLPSFMQHLAVLERAGVIRSHKVGRTRVCRLVPGALEQATEWLGSVRSHWERRLDQLDHVLTTTQTGTEEETDR